LSAPGGAPAPPSAPRPTSWASIAKSTAALALLQEQTNLLPAAMDLPAGVVVAAVVVGLLSKMIPSRW
jgi:hypothetical protein